MSCPYLILYAPSRAAVVEKVQQEPHYPWSLMGVTAPDCLQSTEGGFEVRVVELVVGVEVDVEVEVEVEVDEDGKVGGGAELKVA